MMHKRAELPICCLLLLLAGCGTSSVISRSNEYVERGDYRNAFQVLEDERVRQLDGGGQVTEELAQAHEQRRREFLLWRARWSIFQEREDDALRDLDKLALVAPDYPEMARLRHRAMVKKAMRVVGEADALLARKDFAEAMKLYLESQRLVPGFEPAEEGMKNVRDAMARLSARAQQQFLQAVRKVPEFRFVEVAWHAANVLHDSPEREDARGLRESARKENAQKAFERGRECEKDDQFGAALVLYRQARELDAKLEGVDEAIAQMEREMKASAMIEKAQIDMRSGDFESARKLLSQAFEQSTLARGTISELMILTREREGQEHYRKARDLEVMGKKAEALAAFEALSKDWPDGLEDEQARVSALRVDVEGAATEWAAAEAAEQAGDLPAALDHYINAERFYAEWRNGEAEIERLRQLIAEQEQQKKQAEPAAGESANAGG